MCKITPVICRSAAAEKCRCSRPSCIGHAGINSPPLHREPNRRASSGTREADARIVVAPWGPIANGLPARTAIVLHPQWGLYSR